MKNEELNKKLAEWAGFRGEQIRVQGLLDVLVHAPEGTEYVGDLPNFTQSLDACFKWLVPKIEGLQQIILQPDGDVWYLGMTVDDGLYENIGYDAALALCLAIEKLIDDEEE